MLSLSLFQVIKQAKPTSEYTIPFLIKGKKIPLGIDRPAIRIAKAKVKKIETRKKKTGNEVGPLR